MSGLTRTELGVITVMVQEFERRKLPVLLELRHKLDNGDTLHDAEYDYLSRSIADVCQHMPVTHGHQELQEFCTHVMHLYTEICEKALELEKK